MNRRSLLAFLGLAPIAAPAAAMRMPDRPAVPGEVMELRSEAMERLQAAIVRMNEANQRLEVAMAKLRQDLDAISAIKWPAVSGASHHKVP